MARKTTYNPKRARQLLKQLNLSPTGEKELCARDFGMSCAQFGQLLDGMANYDLICYPLGMQPFTLLIMTEDQKVRVQMGHAAEKFLKDLCSE